MARCGGRVGDAPRRGSAPPAPSSPPPPRRPPDRRSCPWSNGCRPRESTMRRSVRKPLRASSAGPSGPMPIRPVRRRPAAAAAAARPSASAGRQPPLDCSPEMFTWIITSAPGARRPISRAASGRVDGLPDVHPRRQQPDLVALDAAQEMDRRPGRGRRLGQLGHALLGVVLADVPDPAGRGGVDGPGAEGLGDRHHGHPLTARSGDAGLQRRVPLTDDGRIHARRRTHAGSKRVARTPVDGGVLMSAPGGRRWPGGPVRPGPDASRSRRSRCRARGPPRRRRRPRPARPSPRLRGRGPERPRR